LTRTCYRLEVLQHFGGIDGYSSFVGFNPTKQVGVVELCSCDGDDIPLPVRESLALFTPWYCILRLHDQITFTFLLQICYQL